LKIKRVELNFPLVYYLGVWARLIPLILVSGAHTLSAETVSDRLDRLESDISKVKTLLQELTNGDRDKLDPPPPEPTKTIGESYVIRSGDSYWSIARRYKTSVTALLETNPGINPNRLTIGAGITIPSRKGAQNPSTTTRTYRVKSGDILGRISINHGIPLQQLLSANPGLNPQILKIGTILKIPRTNLKPLVSPSGQIQRTQPSDSDHLKSSQVKEIKNRNLGGGDLKKPRLVVIEENLRFSEIAERYETTVTDLNKLNQRDLSPQQMIKSGSQLYILSR
jgi:LysM repeat protein